MAKWVLCARLIDCNGILLLELEYYGYANQKVTIPAPALLGTIEVTLLAASVV